jgi:GNAT superfamily N-acetyltransferase
MSPPDVVATSVAVNRRQRQTWSRGIMFGVSVHTLAERPDLADAAFAIPYGPDAGSFMQGDLAALLTRRSRLARRWPDYVVVVVDVDGTPVARGVSVPFAANLEERETYPAGGWDQIAIWAAEDAMDATVVDTVCALEIAVHPEHQRRGLSAVTLKALKQNTRARGFSRLIAPVRPPGKAREPRTSMDAYARRTREDGLPNDPWLRVHARLGGLVITVAPCSATVQAPLSQWRRWTGLPFDRDGEVLVPGALAPILVSTILDVAVYVEPNVWVLHSTDERV